MKTVISILMILMGVCMYFSLEFGWLLTLEVAAVFIIAIIGTYKDNNAKHHKI